MLTRRLARGAAAALSVITVVSATATGCSRPPEGLPEISEAAYQSLYADWVDSRQAAIASAIQNLGIWPLGEGETPFGSDPALPISIPRPDIPPRAGVLQRKGSQVVVTPAPGARLKLEDGRSIEKPLDLTSGDPRVMVIGTVQIDVSEGSAGVYWVTAYDAAHPDIPKLPRAVVFPIDAEWRLSARFEAFPSPREVQVPDVRGGTTTFTAPGQLVFEAGGKPQRLTAFTIPGSSEFFVMFKDPTNQSSTYSGYRIVMPKAVGANETTVLDFNFASNPPCAYSRFTTCPLPPPENKLDVPVEAGEKRYPGAQGLTF